MKYQILAHPDDEILIGDPEWADTIVIVFTDRLDKVGFGDKRRQALAEHPLATKIWTIGLTESGYWRDSSKLEDYEDNYIELCEWLEDNIKDDDEIITHNAWGEYGHADHKLVHTAVMDTVNCRVNGQDPKLYREIKQVYKSNGTWTWNLTDSI